MTWSGDANIRRRALCVRPKAAAPVAGFLSSIADEWLEALALHCDLTIVEQDFDYRALCDAVQPDFVLFEGLMPARPVPLDIANIDAHPSIPRAAFLAGDPHDCIRPLIFKMFDDFRVETIFAYGYEYLQQMPELGVGIFSVGIFVDSAVYRDYGLTKTIPISIFGGLLAPDFYVWRAEMGRQLPLRFPTLIYTHPGYGTVPSHTYAVMGEDYARLINQSHYSLADTTRLHCIVRKHLEIPAAGAVLVAPDTPPLGDYGFVDMENCILGTGRELYAKIGATGRDRDLYESIRRAGHDLVHGRHTRQHWRYILDWYECRRSLRPGEIVQQVGQFGPFRAAPGDRFQTGMVDLTMPDNEMTAILRNARSAILGDGSLEAAERQLREVTTWVDHVTEPWLLLALIALLRSAPAEASAHLGRSYEIQQGRQGFVSSDPVELAWRQVIARLQGDATLLDSLWQQAEGIEHLSLRRVRFLLTALDGVRGRRPAGLDRRLPGDRLSIHWIGQEDWPNWVNLVGRVLSANGLAAPSFLQS